MPTRSIILPRSHGPNLSPKRHYGVGTIAEQPEGGGRESAQKQNGLKGVGADHCTLSARDGMHDHNARDHHIEHLGGERARERQQERVKRDELRGRDGDPGDRNDDARPALSIPARHDADHLGKRNGGKRTNLRSDPSVKKKADRTYAEPPEGARTNLLREASHAERCGPANDGAHERERAEKRACSAAARKKGAPRARMSLPAEAEPHQNDQINEHKACKHVHDDFFLSIVSGRPTQTSESVPAATTT